MLVATTARIPASTSSVTALCGTDVAATSTAPNPSTRQTPAAIFQSSPTTNSYQKRPKPRRQRIALRGLLHRRPRRTDRGHCEPGDEAPQRENPEQREVASGPLDALSSLREHAEPFDCPERSERREQESEGEFICVLGHG